MKINIKPGKYVLAVSGGVDSMVLLDVLAKQPKVELVVAHFNHGIRSDSSLDENLVRCEAEKHHIKIEVGHGRLSKSVSEAEARKARYEFLHSIKNIYKADAVITAHHQNDLIETAFINILRGTGYKGIVSIINNPNIYRPLLGISKKDILAYAKSNKTKWHEDSTNEDITYLRNYIRKYIMPNLTAEDKQNLLTNIEKVANSTKEINELNATLSQTLLKNNKINRSAFVALPYKVGNEMLTYLLQTKGIEDIDKKTIERLSVVIKTAKPGTKHNIKGKINLLIEKDKARFTT